MNSIDEDELKGLKEQKLAPDLYIRNIRSGSLRKIWLNGPNNMVKSEMFGGPSDGQVGWLGWNFFVELTQTGQFIIEGTQLSTKGGQVNGRNNSKRNR